MCEIDWNLVIQCFNAIGTVAVSILAIWGNYFKYRLVPPEIVIVPSNIKGTVTKFTNGPRVITTLKFKIQGHGRPHDHVTSD